MLGFEDPTSFSAGLGCVAQAATLLVFDFIAERRALPYVEALGALIK